MGLLATLMVFAGCPYGDPQCAVFQARNIAACDAAQTINSFAVRYGLRATATADMRTNTIVVTGDALPVRQTGELLTVLDRRPSQMRCSMVFAQLPAGFAEAVGLGASDGGRWVLTRREARMLTAAVDRTVSQRTDAVILSRPTMTLAENQTGFIRVGEENGDRLVARVTPRTAANDAVLLRLEAQVTDPAADHGSVVRTVYEVLAATALDAGEMVVVRVPLAVRGSQPQSELLLLATVDRLSDNEEQ